MKHFSIICLLFISYSSAHAQKTGHIEVDGFDINFSVSGIESGEQGQPVVVFESDLGTDLRNWYKVFDPVSLI